MDKITTKPNFSCESLTVKEAAKLLNLNRNTLYDLVKARKIPGTSKLGRSIRIHGPTVLAWIQSGQALPKERPRRAK